MTYRVFTYMQDGSLKTILIDEDAISEMYDDGCTDIAQYFVSGYGVEQWSEHGTVDISGPGKEMLSDVMISD